MDSTEEDAVLMKMQTGDLLDKYPCRSGWGQTTSGFGVIVWFREGLIARSRHFQPFLISEHRPFFTTSISIIIAFSDFFSRHTLLSITFCFPVTLDEYD
jgi:hypothetical protein